MSAPVEVRKVAKAGTLGTCSSAWSAGYAEYPRQRRAAAALTPRASRARDNMRRAIVQSHCACAVEIRTAPAATTIMTRSSNVLVVMAVGEVKQIGQRDGAPALSLVVGRSMAAYRADVNLGNSVPTNAPGRRLRQNANAEIRRWSSSLWRCPDPQCSAPIAYCSCQIAAYCRTSRSAAAPRGCFAQH